MLTFIIVASIMLAVSLADFNMTVKAKQKRLKVFYAASICLSLALAAVHCLGINLNFIRF